VGTSNTDPQPAAGLPDPQPIDEYRSLQLSARVGTPPLALARRVDAEHRDVAAVATAQTLEDRHRHRPPGAVAPGDAEDPITADHTPHTAKHRLSVAGLVDTVDLDRCVLHAATLSAGGRSHIAPQARVDLRPQSEALTTTVVRDRA
jgi:hypothetical protein